MLAAETSNRDVNWFTMTVGNISTIGLDRDRKIDIYSINFPAAWEQGSMTRANVNYERSGLLNKKLFVIVVWISIESELWHNINFLKTNKT